MDASRSVVVGKFRCEGQAAASATLVSTSSDRSESLEGQANCSAHRKRSYFYPLPFNSCYRDATLAELRQHLPISWVAVPEEQGINVMCLSSSREKSIRKRAYFSFTGVEEISVHRKPICGYMLENILRPDSSGNGVPVGKQLWRAFMKRILTVVERLQMTEICVGVDNAEYKLLWSIDKSGDIDSNPFGETTYQETFRPFACHLLVPTSGHHKQRCSVCIQKKIRFRVKIQNHKSSLADSRTPNLHLDRYQLLRKLNNLTQKLKYCQAQLKRLKAEKIGSCHCTCQHSNMTDEIFDICLAYTNRKP